MRLLSVLLLSAVVIMANGCALTKKIPCPKLPKIPQIFNSDRNARLIPNVFRSKGRAPRGIQSASTDNQCGCDYCKTVRLTGEPPVQYIAPVPVSAPMPVENDMDWNELHGSEVYGNEIVTEGSNLYPQVELPNTSPQVVPPNPFPATPAESSQQPVQTLDLEPKSNSFERPVEEPTLTPPASEIKVEPQQAAPDNPYVDPRPDLIPEVPGVTVPDLQGGSGFLAPETLIPPTNDKIQAIPASSKKEIRPIDSEEATPEPFHTLKKEDKEETPRSPLPAKRIETEDMIVLKARPVRRHRINNSKPYARTANRTKNVYQYDQHGLPIDRPVEFNSLPPVDDAALDRKLQLKRNPEAMLPEDLPRLPTIETDNKAKKPLINQTTRVQSKNSMDRGNFVAESTVYQEPILRMTAKPTEYQDYRQDVSAKIRFGQQTIVRGQYPGTESKITGNISQAKRTDDTSKALFRIIER